MYDFRLSENRTLILDENQWLAQDGSLIYLNESFIISGNMTPIDAGCLSKEYKIDEV